MGEYALRILLISEKTTLTNFSNSIKTFLEGKLCFIRALHEL